MLDGVLREVDAGHLSGHGGQQRAAVALARSNVQNGFPRAELQGEKVPVQMLMADLAFHQSGEPLAREFQARSWQGDSECLLVGAHQDDAGGPAFGGLRVLVVQ